ncbi:MAG: GerMN domain-containing protein [bacterium]|nr:GerMN domain-containing protein [bacterium]
MKKWLYLLFGIVLCIAALLTLQCCNSRGPQNEPVPATRQILVYFNRSEPTEIVQVAVNRTIPATETSAAEAAIMELLKGPTDAERAEGLSTAMNEGTVLNYVRIENGLATVDFNDRFDFQMGGSARVGAIYQQIYKTLNQFSAIDEIKITVNHGERPAILEP